MPRRKETVSDQLRRAIAESGVSRYRLWQATGVSQASLSRFLHGQADLSLGAVDAIADYLGLALVRTEPNRAGEAEPRKRRDKR
jgi:transcriptional regulator with XRE-family HTH domain